jgi:hypothetical protein
MGWERQKPLTITAPVPLATGRWLLAGLLAAMVGVLLFSLHALKQLMWLQNVNIWLVALLPLVGWCLIFSARGYFYGRELSDYAFLQDEARHAQQEWQRWAGRYMAVQASCVLLPDQITVSYLARDPKDLEFQYGLVRHIDYLTGEASLEIQAMTALLGSIEQALNSLPQDMALRATILTDAPEEDFSELQVAWQQCWEAKVTQRPAPEVTLLSEKPYTAVESWLKNAITGAELVLVLQLRGEDNYSDGLAIFLLTTDDEAEKYRLPVAGRLLRPMPLVVDDAKNELTLFMETQPLARKADSVLADSIRLMPLIPIIIPVGHQQGASFSAESMLVQEAYTGIPGPFSAWLLAAFGLDFTYYYGVPYVVLSLASQNEVVSTVSPGVC